jgi:hypothetical protein
LSILSNIDYKDYINLVDNSNDYRYNISYTDFIPLIINALKDIINRVNILSKIINNHDNYTK